MNYQSIHDSIIEKARSENRMKGKEVYYEAHHIVPRCMGGKGKVSEWKIHPNIVLLTGREHIIIHRLLCEIYPDNHKLIHAYWMLANVVNKKHHKEDDNYRISSKEYERLRIECAKIQSERPVSEETRKKHSQNTKGENNPNFNKMASEETRKKISEKSKGKTPWNKGKNQPQTAGEKNPFFNKKHTEETKQILREKATGRIPSDETRKKISEGVKGKMEGGEHPQSKKVKNTKTGEIFDCIKDAAEHYGIKYGTLLDCLNPKRRQKNKTDLVYV